MPRSHTHFKEASGTCQTSLNSSFLQLLTTPHCTPPIKLHQAPNKFEWRSLTRSFQYIFSQDWQDIFQRVVWSIKHDKTFFKYIGEKSGFHSFFKKSPFLASFSFHSSLLFCSWQWIKIPDGCLRTRCRKIYSADCATARSALCARKNKLTLRLFSTFSYLLLLWKDKTQHCVASSC